MLKKVMDSLVTAIWAEFAALGLLKWAKECVKGVSNLCHLRVTENSHLELLMMIYNNNFALQLSVFEKIGRQMVWKNPELENTEVVDLQELFMTFLIPLILYKMGYMNADASFYVCVRW